MNEWKKLSAKLYFSNWIWCHRLIPSERLSVDWISVCFSLSFFITLFFSQSWLDLIGTFVFELKCHFLPSNLIISNISPNKLFTKKYIWCFQWKSVYLYVTCTSSNKLLELKWFFKETNKSKIWKVAQITLRTFFQRAGMENTHFVKTHKHDRKISGGSLCEKSLWYFGIFYL